MSTTEIIPATNQSLTPPADPKWDQVRLWADRAAKFQRGALACQVMAGFELIALRDQYPKDLGRPTNRKQEKSYQIGMTFKQLIENQLAIPNTTAYRWMQMAASIKTKYAALDTPDRLRALLLAPPQAWTGDDSALLTDFVHEISDGKTQTQFMRDLGIARRPRPSTKPARTFLARYTRACHVFFRSAPNGGSDDADWKAAAEALLRYRLSFVGESDAAIRSQIANLKFHLTLRLDWLAQPKEQRAPETIAHLLKQNPPNK